MKKRGFTLVEVLVVVVIVVLVTMFAVPSYKKAQTANQKKMALAVLEELAQGVRMLNLDYPDATSSTITVTNIAASGSSSSPSNATDIGFMVRNNYLRQVNFTSNKYQGYSFKISWPSTVSCTAGCTGIACMTNGAECAAVSKDGTLTF